MSVMAAPLGNGMGVPNFNSGVVMNLAQGSSHGQLLNGALPIHMHMHEGVGQM